MIVFIRHGEDGPILIKTSNDPKRTLAAFQFKQPVKLTIIGTMVQTRNAIERLRFAFKHLHMRGDWYRPEPELLAFISRPGESLGFNVFGRPRRKGPALLDEHEIIEIFRAAWANKETDAQIGARYGISHISVGQIARAMVHKHLFRRTETERFGHYHVAEAYDGAPKHLLRAGRRSR